MEIKRKFPPREGDLPIGELMNRANIKLLQDQADGVQTDIHFKFTCENCGERCMLSEPNQLFEYGECHKCGHETKIVVGGFTTVSRIVGERQS